MDAVEETAAGMQSIPIIDISPLVRLSAGGGGGGGGGDDRLREVVEQISHACTDFGFFAVTDHGVDRDVTSRAWGASRDFFDCDPAVKGSVRMSGDYVYGYEDGEETLGTERAAAAAEKECGGDGSGGAPPPALRPDSKETFSIGPIDSERSGMPPRQFPAGADPSFAPALEGYFAAMEQLARTLFRGLAMALKLDDPSWFLREGCFDEGHQCALRLLNYPQLEYRLDEDEARTVHIRAGAHTDYGAMTILKSGGPGLQLQLSPRDANGQVGDGGGSSSEWIDVPYLPDAFIINLGDLMQRWTNNRWRSTLHRVIAVPDSGDGASTDRVFQSARRQSIAFFVNMNGSATIVPFESCVDEGCPSRYGPIKASDHLIQRHRQSMSKKEPMEL